jgi:hypothetical protein
MDSRFLSYGKEKESRSRSGSTTPFGYVKGTLWFETQDSISYWEDFSKPKIVWKIIGNQMAFAYDANNYVMNNACYIMTGDHLDYLLAVLNFSNN